MHGGTSSSLRLRAGARAGSLPAPERDNPHAFGASPYPRESDVDPRGDFYKLPRASCGAQAFVPTRIRAQRNGTIAADSTAVPAAWELAFLGPSRDSRVIILPAMESSLVEAAAASLCPAAGGRRRAGSAASFLNCSCSSKEYRVSASYSIGRVLSGVRSAARKKLLRSEPADLQLGINWSDSNGAGHHWWTALENNFVLEASDDEYGGVVVDADRLPSDKAAFARSLAASLSYWKSVGKKGVWLKLPVDRSEFVPIAVKGGFKYHHAEEAYVMLTYWIPDEPCLLPANASHQVGVGGFVINDQMEVLVVQEKYRVSTLDGAWKLPTGFILASEEIFTGAIREVKEETGVDTEFVDVVAFRHAHNVAFQKSDLFFICMLRPVSNEIKIDETEIQAAKWMPLEEFVKQPFIQEDRMFQKIVDICIQRLRKCYCGLKAHNVISKFDNRRSTLYYNVPEPEDVNCSAA